MLTYLHEKHETGHQVCFYKKERYSYTFLLREIYLHTCTAVMKTALNISTIVILFFHESYIKGNLDSLQ